MQINVRLFGSLRERLPQEQRGSTRLELPSNAIVQDVLDALAIDEYVLVTVNNDHESDLQTTLQAGDMVLVFEAAAGG